MNRLRGTELSVALGDMEVLKGVDFSLGRGEMLGLVGPNGAGKTTLLRLLAGLLPPSAGELTWEGRGYRQLSLRERAQRISYLAQSGTAHWPMSVERLVALGRLPHLSDWQKPNAADRQRIERVIGETDLAELRERQFNTLSGGEKSRVLIARALVGEPEVLLADEPVAALDLAHQIEVMTLLQRYCEQGGAAVVVLHDLRLAAHYCHRLMLMVNGRTLAEGDAASVLSADNMARAFGVRLRDPTAAMADTLRMPWMLDH